MRRKPRVGIDLRDVAIYTRKSKLTHMGDSTGVQMKQSADFARSQLNLPEDYPFLEYEDKGLSGYYADRPDFQRMLHDIEAGKIRAVVCYKLDRISRKTSDLLRLIDFFNKHDVALLVCSNNINTLISTSKIMLSFLAIIAEFERDIIAERIADNLIELAKDGRWMGGCTPTGFKAIRNTIGSGKNKTSITHLEPIPDEKAMIQQIFKTFRQCRSINQTATIIGKDYKTKFGKEHTTLSIKDILSNPIYCIADEISFDYFYQKNGNICSDEKEFDAIHGIMAYNKTDQERLEDEESTFIEPKFVQVCSDKPIAEWIISVGKHEGFIPSAEWIETQELLGAIADKYNRPHRATNALLGGLVYCPICGGRLHVLPESNRWTNGKPRFKYGCPKRRGKEKCGFKSIDGNRLDDFVMEQLGKIAEQDSEYYTKILDSKMQSLIKNDSNERDLAEARKRKEKIQSSIATQVKNLREADESIKRYIQDDITVLSDELAQTERIIAKLEQAHQGQQDMMKGLSEVKKTLLNFNSLIADMEYEDKLSLLTTLIERIIVAPNEKEEICHIFIKGCSNEEYDDFFRESESEMCDLDRHSKLHSYLCRDTASLCMQPIYERHEEPLWAGL